MYDYLNSSMYAASFEPDEYPEKDWRLKDDVYYFEWVFDDGSKDGEFCECEIDEYDYEDAKKCDIVEINIYDVYEAYYYMPHYYYRNGKLCCRKNVIEGYDEELEKEDIIRTVRL